MAKRALRKKEDIEAVPLDQPVELDLSDDPIVQIASEDEDLKPQKPVNGTAVIEPIEPDQGPDKAALQKQLDDLRASEAANRSEMERQLQEANKRNLELQQQTSQHQVSELEAQYDAVLNALNAAEAESQSASQLYESALANGDYKAASEAQRKISRAEARLESLEQGKGALEARREEMKRVPPRQEQPTDPFEAQIANLPDPAKNWLRGHREYMIDPRKNAKIQAAHWDVVEDGIPAYSEGYFPALEVKLGLRQAPNNDPDNEPDPPRRTPVSAPVSREIASPSTGRSTPQKVTLTAEERDIARQSMPGTDPGEAERIYAQQKLRLQEAKKQGHYREQ